MDIKTINLNEYNPAPYNPRIDLCPGDEEYEKLKRSINELGYIDPIIVNEKTKNIVGGHQRAKILKDIGQTSVKAVVVNFSLEQEKLANLALNKISGKWDEEKLKDILIDLEKSGADTTLSGFDKIEIDNITHLEDIEAQAQDDDFDEEKAIHDAQNKCICKFGDLWQLGDHRLLCGDATIASDLLELLDGQVANLVIMDPPYDVGYEAKSNFVNSRSHYNINSRVNNQIQNDSISEADFREFLKRLFLNTYNVMGKGSVFYVFFAECNDIAFRKALLNAKLKISQCLIWEKNHFVLGRSDYHYRHEPILYGWKEGAQHYFVKDRTQDTLILEDEIELNNLSKAELIKLYKDTIKNYSSHTSVIYEDKPQKSSLHPTMKPVTLLGRFINNSSKSDDIIYDPCGGSGSTLIAAEQLHRRSYVVEIDPVYCSVIIKRWEDLTEKKAKKIKNII